MDRESKTLVPILGRLQERDTMYALSPQELGYLRVSR